jgi:hypothetical protein
MQRAHKFQPSEPPFWRPKSLIDRAEPKCFVYRPLAELQPRRCLDIGAARMLDPGRIDTHTSIMNSET